MNDTSQNLLERAMNLPETDRGRLAEQLLASLESATDADREAAWSNEIHQRLEEVRSGKSKPIPWEEARRQILEDSDGNTR